MIYKSHCIIPKLRASSGLRYPTTGDCLTTMSKRWVISDISKCITFRNENGVLCMKMATTAVNSTSVTSCELKLTVCTSATSWLFDKNPLWLGGEAKITKSIVALPKWRHKCICCCWGFYFQTYNQTLCKMCKKTPACMLFKKNLHTLLQLYVIINNIHWLYSYQNPT